MKLGLALRAAAEEGEAEARGEAEVEVGGASSRRVGVLLLL
jgi:hypothetical protein